MGSENTWSELEQDTAAAVSGYHARRIRPEAAADLFLAIDRGSGTRSLLLRISASAARRIPVIRCTGFEAKQVFLPGGDPSRGTLVVRLADGRFRDVFTVLVDDLVEHVAGASAEAAAVRSFQERLDHWKRFMERHPPEGLNRDEQLGLYGELWFLRRYLLPHLGHSQAVEAWAGPLASNQDFQIAGSAVESKTTAMKMHQKLHIASERQLDATGVSHLILFHLSLDERQGSGETLAAIVREIREVLAQDPVDLQEFDRRLLEVGYLDCHAEAYGSLGYAVRESNLFGVNGDFPRIIEDDLRTGVGDVRYTISVAECKHYSIQETDFLGIMKGEGQ